MKTEMLEVKKIFAKPRRCRIDDSILDDSDESFIPQEDMVVTISNSGYVKRLALDTYRVQKRGGRGKQGVSNSDLITQFFVADTHQKILFFTKVGQAYAIKVYQLPIASTQAMGRSLVNIFPITLEDKIMAALPLPLIRNGEHSLIFITSKGYVRRNAITDFEGLRVTGKIAIRLDDDEELIDVLLADISNDIILTASNGKSVRFKVENLRVFNSRTSRGVRGMLLDENDKVVSASLINNQEDAHILTVTEKGYGKRTSINNYRCCNRGAKGVRTTIINKTTGSVVGAYHVYDSDDLLIMNSNGQVIRSAMNEIRVTNRCAQGVRLLRLDDDTIVSQVFAIREL